MAANVVSRMTQEIAQRTFTILQSNRSLQSLNRMAGLLGQNIPSSFVPTAGVKDEAQKVIEHGARARAAYDAAQNLSAGPRPVPGSPGYDDYIDELSEAYGTMAGSVAGAAWGTAKTAGLAYWDMVSPFGMFDSARGGIAGYAKRAGTVLGAGAALRWARGGSITRNPEGERDISGIPFI